MQREVAQSQLFDAVDLSTDRTATVSVRGYNQLTLYCTLVLNASTTALTLEPACRPKEDANYFDEVEEDTSSPPTVGVDVTGRKYNLLAGGPSADTYRFVLHIPVSGYECQITLNQTGDTADSTFSAIGVLSVQ